MSEKIRAGSGSTRIRPAPDVGDVLDVLFLGRVRGLMMHFVKDGKKKKPRHCAGVAECPPKIHSLGTHWKGYAPAYFWDGVVNLAWTKCVVEVTPHCWEQLKGLELRSTQWKIFRQLDEDGHKPVHGLLVKQWTKKDTPEAFDISVVLMRAYGTAELRLDVACPLPEAPAADTIAINPPEAFERMPKPAPATREEIEEWRKQFAEDRKRLGL